MDDKAIIAGLTARMWRNVSTILILLYGMLSHLPNRILWQAM